MTTQDISNKIWKITLDDKEFFLDSSETRAHVVHIAKTLGVPEEFLKEKTAYTPIKLDFEVKDNSMRKFMKSWMRVVSHSSKTPCRILTTNGFRKLNSRQRKKAYLAGRLIYVYPKDLQSFQQAESQIVNLNVTFDFNNFPI